MIFQKFKTEITMNFKYGWSTTFTKKNYLEKKFLKLTIDKNE